MEECFYEEIGDECECSKCAERKELAFERAYDAYKEEQVFKSLP